MFANETPFDIKDWEIDDVLKLVKDPEDYTGPSPKVRLNLIKMLYDIQGLELTPDAALAAISVNNANLIIATAGSGKTTLIQMKSLLFKLIMHSKYGNDKKINGNEILCLVYNRHNVPDLKERHARLVERLYSANIKGLDIDSDIHASTMHSFCDYWRKQYVAKLGLIGFNLMTDTMSIAMMERSLRITYKVLKIPETPQATAEQLLSFYVLCKETLRSPEEMVESDKFKDIGLDVDIISTCFERYESSKKLKRVYDFSDMLVRFYNLIKNDEEVLKNIQGYYTVIIADEVQDFTPIMWKILQLLVNNGTHLECIGDEDQSIYYFRGANIHDLLNFSSDFNNGKVYTLVYNRRCKKAILDEAVNVISENTLRFDKHLTGTKEGGELHFIPYNSIEGQVLSIVDNITNMSEEEREKTVICFREQHCSKLIVDYLAANKIQYNSLQGMLPYSYELYKHVFDILNALEMPYKSEALVNLYKVLPCTKQQLHDALGYDSVHKKFSDSTKKHFAQYDYGNLLNIKGFVEILTELTEISNAIQLDPMNTYIPKIFKLLYRYYWDFIKNQRFDMLDDIMEDRVFNYFNSNLRYGDFYKRYTSDLNYARRSNELARGVTLSTFHGLKGLEFEHVYVTFMNDEIFPNFSLIDKKGYSPQVNKELKESETRLWYVTLTRAINDITVYYDSTIPSRYVLDYLDRKDNVFINEKSQSETPLEIKEVQKLNTNVFNEKTSNNVEEKVVGSHVNEISMNDVFESTNHSEDSTAVNSNSINSPLNTIEDSLISPTNATVSNDTLTKLISNF